MMKLTDFQQKITALLPKIELRYNEMLARHTSFRIGGPAEVMAFPNSVEALIEILKVSKDLDCNFAILGAGTNVLAPDEGVQGLVVCLKDCLDSLERLDDTRIRVGAGVTMSRAAVFAAKCCLGGMEFTHGIPGTVGGGVYMNAGAYGGEIAQICESVDVVYPDGKCITIPAGEMEFSYRHSRLEDDGGIVVSAVFALTKRPEEEVRSQMQELMQRRKNFQPLDLPSAGSAFKRPASGYAAALIDECGLKGYQVGGAAVSKKHAGFVVNVDNATATDVRQLLQQVSQRVYDKTGIRLEPEVRIW